MKANDPVWREKRMHLRTAPMLHRCEPSWAWSPQPFSDHDLWCVIEGAGWLEIDGTRHGLSPGVCFLFSPGARPTASHDPRNPLSVFACHFDFDPSDGGAEPTLPSLCRNMPLRFPDRIFLEQLARSAVRGLRLAPADDFSRAELSLWQILIELSPEPARGGRTDSRIRECIEAIEREPSAAWTLARLARVAGLSQTHLLRLFREMAGHSPLRHVIQCRVNRAQTLLAESNLSVAEIAEALGYRDVFFFTRQFRMVAGMPPARYRRERRG